MNDMTGDPTLKVFPRVVKESMRSDIRKSRRLFQSKSSLLWVTIGSEVIVAIPDTTEFDWLACAIGPVASGKIRSVAIAVPNNVPSKIMASNVLVSISLLENRRIKTRATKIKVAPIALAQIGFASPADVMTIAAESQVATASELSRKSN
jgi:hypothetical protein